MAKERKLNPYDDPNTTEPVIERIKNQNVIYGIKPFPLTPDDPQNLLSSYIHVVGKDTDEKKRTAYRKTPYDIFLVQSFQGHPEGKPTNQPFTTRVYPLIKQLDTNALNAIQQGEKLVAEIKAARQAAMDREAAQFRKQLEDSPDIFVANPPTTEKPVSPFAQGYRDRIPAEETPDARRAREEKQFDQAVTQVTKEFLKYTSGKLAPSAEEIALHKDDIAAKLRSSQAHWEAQVAAVMTNHLTQNDGFADLDKIRTEAEREVLDIVSAVTESVVINPSKMGEAYCLAEIRDPEGLEQRMIDYADEHANFTIVNTTNDEVLTRSEEVVEEDDDEPVLGQQSAQSIGEQEAEWKEQKHNIRGKGKNEDKGKGK